MDNDTKAILDVLIRIEKRLGDLEKNFSELVKKHNEHVNDLNGHKE